MWLFLFIGIVALILLLLAGRWYSRARASDIMFIIRTFIAVFSALASTGLIYAGRFGLAAITVIATFVAIRTMLKRRQGADPLHDGFAGSGSSSVETDLLSMVLDRSTGDVSGTVKAGPFEGRDLQSLSFDELMQLLGFARQSDAESVAILETFLDRAWPDWREGDSQSARDSGAESMSRGPMTETLALEILGLEQSASVEDIKRAHKRLMAKLHPDLGGSTLLASEINRAKDFLLRARSVS